MTSTMYPLLTHYSSAKLGGGEGRADFKFWPIRGRLFEGGAHSRGGANSRIYGILATSWSGV